MAVVKEIRQISKANKSKTETLLDYSIDNDIFSIWTYSASDKDGSGDPPQNIALNKKFARELRDALSDFLHE